MTPAQKSAVAILRAAKREIETKGWTQKESGGVEDSDGPCCAWIALARARSGTADAPMQIVADALRGAIGTRSVPTWNDQPGRTVDEVLSAFDKAIALVESGAVS